MRSRISSEISRLRKKEERLRGPAIKIEHLKPIVDSRPLVQLPLSQAQAMALWQGWWKSLSRTPAKFQQEAQKAYLESDFEGGGIFAPTGSGKTLAAFSGPIFEALVEGPTGLHCLVISPLKALTRDLALALEKPINELRLPLRVATRTGDTSAKDRRLLKRDPPQFLITTPESLALLLADDEWLTLLSSTRAVVIDEWHELYGTKRGTLLELSLARLRRERSGGPPLKTWVLSATLPSPEKKLSRWSGIERPPRIIFETGVARKVIVRSLLQKGSSPLPWYGFSGLRLAREVVQAVRAKGTTLLFTNARSHAERWHQEIRQLAPDLHEEIALHHGSIDQTERARVETNLKAGQARLVIATSSLDLGVDFSQVDQVIQVGSMKAFSRAHQRAGRAFHRPGEDTEIVLCPSHLFQLIEVLALRDGIGQNRIEEKTAIHAPLDVLLQFLLNSAIGKGFDQEEMFRLLISTETYSTLKRVEFEWALLFLTRGGYALSAYPEYRKLVEDDGRYHFFHERLAFDHRLNMGTIVSEEGIRVQFVNGSRIGTIDEHFISSLKIGDTFSFAGKTLELVRLKDLVAHVKQAKAKSTAVPIWTGSEFPISSALSDSIKTVVEKLKSSHAIGVTSEENMQLQMIRDRQLKQSDIPAKNELLIEHYVSNEGHHLFIYPFEGQLLHQGFGHLLALRLSRLHENTFAVSATDHGIELLSTEPPGTFDEIIQCMTETQGLADETESSLNLNELARRTFREIARVACLISQGRPHQRKTAKQLQMSSGLLFDVLKNHEPDHLLLKQAEREAREKYLEIERMQELIESIAQRQVLFKEISEPTPFCFPLIVARMSSRLSNEKLETRIDRFQKRALK